MIAISIFMINICVKKVERMKKMKTRKFSKWTWFASKASIF